MSWAKQFSSSNREVVCEDSGATSRDHLSDGWIILNIDGAVQVDSGHAKARGVLRDVNGDWILGYNKYLRKCSIFDVEL